MPPVPFRVNRWQSALPRQSAIRNNPVLQSLTSLFTLISQKIHALGNDGLIYYCQ